MKVLYVSDKPDWAIQNVGRMWLEGQPGIEATFILAEDLSPDNFAQFDMVWFGFSLLFFSFYTTHRMSAAELAKSVVAVHDPCEVLSQRPNWKEIPARGQSSYVTPSCWPWLVRTSMLKAAGTVITASEELLLLLGSRGVKAELVSTTTDLPLRQSLTPSRPAFVSVYYPHARKNERLMRELQVFARERLGAAFDTKVGDTVLDREGYMKLFDSHSVYVCTSWQEGGPLPAMDAMARGCTVLSTPVGQIQELIRDGENGFLCETEQDFIRAMQLITDQPEMLERMRLMALDTISRERNLVDIRRRAREIVMGTANREGSYGHSSLMRWYAHRVAQTAIGNSVIRSLVPMIRGLRGDGAH